MPDRPPRSCPLLAGAVVGAAAIALGGCVDLSFLSAVAFPPGVPGLPAAEKWVSLPVNVMLTEGNLEPLGIAACSSAACGGPAVVGLFGASGPEAARLRQDAGAPARLAAFLMRPPSPSRTGRRAADAAARVVANARAVRHGGATGVAVSMRRQDGTGAVFGEALVASAGPRTLALVVIASDPERADTLAQEIAAAL